MTDNGSFNRRRAYELVGVTLDLANHMNTDNDERDVAVCIMMPDSGPGFPVASAIQGEADLSEINMAANMCSTVLAWGRNTEALARSYTVVDTLSAQASHAFFCPHDGGIRVYNHSGSVICVLAVSGRTGLGNRVLAVKAAHHMGYQTDFNEEGLTVAEANRPAEEFPRLAITPRR